MITLDKLLKTIREALPSIELRYLYPSLYVIFTESAFENKTQEERAMHFASQVNLDQEEIETTASRAGWIFVLVTPQERTSEYDFLESAPPSHHWVEFLASSEGSPAKAPKIPVVHFYGFKGGQARSTVLAMTAQSLADDGYNVVVIDADVEAPSLQAVFTTAATRLESTIFGCAQFNLLPDPQAVLIPKGGNGRVDLLACRPTETSYDLDFANFALRSSLDPQMLELVISKLLASKESKYDLLFVDHRTGLSPSVIPVAASFPGPTVVCLRLDEQSDRAEAYFDVLFRLNPESPGLFVSFSLDPEENQEAMLGRHRAKIESLLQGISDGLRAGVTGQDGDSNEEALDSVQPDDLIRYWVPWFHDRNFLSKRLPLVAEILSSNQRSISAIREILGLSSRKAVPVLVPQTTPNRSNTKLTGSGNTDQGPLIEADALRKLRASSTPYTYILGRKGTGKTRLLRTLAEAQLGDPLLVADDYPHPFGLLSSDPLLADLSANLPHDPAKLWWALLDAGLAGTARETQRTRLQEIVSLISTNGATAFSTTTVRDRVLQLHARRVLLVDGVETAFNASQTATFIEGLFRFLASVQSDIEVSQRLIIRLFIRTDLVEGARENIEQQLENRVLRLAWDTQSILNFVLVRIASIPWFREKFPHPVTTIDSREVELIQGVVPEDECGVVLLEIFPEKVRRNNVGMLTFLKTYFSDGQGEKASFYPRVYDSFLRFIADGGLIESSSKVVQIENDRVEQDLIFEAHAHACKDYLKQVKDELKNLLNLAANPSNNQERIGDLLDGFNGMTTPFDLEQTVAALHRKIVPVIFEGDIRKSMLQMKRVGIFEDRPEYPGQWRVGRLFKSSLGMKYNRRVRGES